MKMGNYKVIEMDLKDKWWDKWFVVADLTIDILLHDCKSMPLCGMGLLC